MPAQLPTDVLGSQCNLLFYNVLLVMAGMAPSWSRGCAPWPAGQLRPSGRRMSAAAAAAPHGAARALGLVVHVVELCHAALVDEEGHEAGKHGDARERGRVPPAAAAAAAAAVEARTT